MANLTTLCGKLQEINDLINEINASENVVLGLSGTWMHGKHFQMSIHVNGVDMGEMVVEDETPHYLYCSKNIDDIRVTQYIDKEN